MKSDILGSKKIHSNWKEEDIAYYEKAIEFAKAAHKGAKRKGSDVPYINHPIETSLIVYDMTDDVEVIAAAVLHDVIEDTEFSEEDIRREFGDRVARLVADESEDKMRHISAAESWSARKEATIKHLKTASLEVKMIALADKLSNMRDTMRDYSLVGDDVWLKFNQKDKKKHEWYQNGILENTKELKDTEAWKEYKKLCDKVFKDGNNL
ncbi:MAG: bifunctional (p)ppGpp synthetase/guanosine-3',5'-bis(diphosphate) 3'-pyrophosphohydrolase [Lachnospiraceae bacterium]|nr:bifunctional (p)ppGpp synthetase/guanosine-3',5'-bis(diphosphate) 3'-pyrophosphohydrolase [Lachnospiraceae bacterium]MBQ4069225.1 bifunctional (p)ppGpp synthetase/guanosine-3',5'-bis(diphosphate) 3'-pyrophosphohydrolase [Lachnospiraceae bacterium]